MYARHRARVAACRSLLRARIAARRPFLRNAYSLMLQGEVPQQEYRALIVDEVQDLSEIGLKLLHLLVGDRRDGLPRSRHGPRTRGPPMRRRILIEGGDAGVDRGCHEPRLIGWMETGSCGGWPPLSPFCLRLGCGPVRGHGRPHTGRGWKLRETTTRLVRLAGVEPAPLGLEVRRAIS